MGDAVWATPFGRCRLGDETFGRWATWATGHLGDEPFGRQYVWAMLFGRGNIFSKVFYFLIFNFLAELFISSKFSLYAEIVLRSCDSLTTQCKVFFNRITLLELLILLILITISNLEFNIEQLFHILLFHNILDILSSRDKQKFLHQGYMYVCSIFVLQYSSIRN